MWGRVGRDSVIFAGSALLMAVLQVAFRLLAIHDLSVTEYGKVGLLIGVFNIAAIVGAYGVPVATARLAARTEGAERGNHLMRSALRAAALPCVGASLLFAAVTLVVTHSGSVAAASAVGTPPMVFAIVLGGFLRGKGLVWRSASVQPANALAQLGVLLILPALHVHVSLAWVLVSFYVGNIASLVFASVFARQWRLTAPQAVGGPDPETAVSRILAFSTWLTLSNVAIMGLTVLPRIALAHVSYAEVAFFDLALLIYSIPQRLTASLVLALVPLAASQETRGGRVTVPTITDALLLTGVFALVDGILWWTHAVPHVLRLSGLAKYVGAEHVLLVVLLAAPAELFFSINSGLLQAFGRSRRLAAMTVGVLSVSTAIAGVLIDYGSIWLAALLALDFWALYLASSQFSGMAVVRRSIFASFMPGGSPRQVPA